MEVTVVAGILVVENTVVVDVVPVPTGTVVVEKRVVVTVEVKVGVTVAVTVVPATPDVTVAVVRIVRVTVPPFFVLMKVSSVM
jgi:hypothetical protein